MYYFYQKTLCAVQRANIPRYHLNSPDNIRPSAQKRLDAVTRVNGTAYSAERFSACGFGMYFVCPACRLTPAGGSLCCAKHITSSLHSLLRYAIVVR